MVNEVKIFGPAKNESFCKVRFQIEEQLSIKIGENFEVKKLWDSQLLNIKRQSLRLIFEIQCKIRKIWLNFDIFSHCGTAVKKCIAWKITLDKKGLKFKIKMKFHLVQVKSRDYISLRLRSNLKGKCNV